MTRCRRTSLPSQQSPGPHRATWILIRALTDCISPAIRPTRKDAGGVAALACLRATASFAARGNVHKRPASPTEREQFDGRVALLSSD